MTSITYHNFNQIPADVSGEQIFLTFLEAYLKNSKEKTIPKLILEKLLVIVFKIGVEKGFFENFEAEKTQGSLSIKYYHHGSIVTENNSSENEDPFFVEEDSMFFSNTLTRKKFENFYWQVYSWKDFHKPHPSELAKKLYFPYITSVGKLFSIVINEQKLLNSDDLVILTSCYSTNDILGSLYAELKTFKKYYSKDSSFLAPVVKDNERQYSTALNSGLFKFKHFILKTPQLIKQRVSSQLDNQNSALWDAIWPESNLDFNLVHEPTLKKILEYGMTLYKLQFLIFLISIDGEQPESKFSEGNTKIKSFIDLLTNIPKKLAKKASDELYKFNKVSMSILSIEDILKEIFSITSKFDDSGIQISESPRIESDNQVNILRQLKNKGIVNVLLASPGDTNLERKYLIDKLERKFRIDGHEDHCEKRLIIHAWEDIASQNGYGQDIINYKYLKNVDIVVAFFKHKLGTPTVDAKGNKRADSGTAEELLYAIDSNLPGFPLGMVYFHERPPVVELDDPNFDRIKEDWERLKGFRKSIQNKILYKSYDNRPDLLNKICVDLSQNIRENFS